MNYEKEIKKDVSGRIAIGLKVREKLYLKLVEEAKKEERSVSNFVNQVLKRLYNITE